jgi:hypothetical protein
MQANFISSVSSASGSSRVSASTSESYLPLVWERLLTGVWFTLGVGLTAACLPAHSAELTAQVPAPTAEPPTAVVTDALPNGTYVYGEASQPNQIGATYLVLRVRDRQVVGAFFTPSSSFDCFRGQFQRNRLSLSIVNSYDRTVYDYSVPLQPPTPVATTQAVARSAPVELAGYHRLATVSQADQAMVQTCQARYSTALPNRPQP